MTKQQYLELKQELKDLALYIKVKRNPTRKNLPTDQLNPGIKCSMTFASYEYRHKHIVISLMRGRTREQIEKPKENHLPNEKYISQLLEKYATVEQVVCVSA